MEVMLIVGLFASSALSLNFIVNQKYKLAGSMNIINLCLVVATAYQFDQVKNIVWLFGIAAGVVLVYFVVRFLLKKKKKEKQQSNTISSMRHAHSFGHGSWDDQDFQSSCGRLHNPLQYAGRNPVRLLFRSS